MGLGIRSEACSIGDGGAVFVATDGTSNGLVKFASNVLLKCRLVRSLSVRLRQPFEAKWENQIREGLSNIAWSSYYSKSANTPDVCFKAKNSRLTSSKHIESLIRESFRSIQGKDSNTQLDLFSRTDACIGENSLPSISAYLNADLMDIYADLGGEYPNQIHMDNYGEKSRLKLNSIMASAVAMTVADNIPAKSGSRLSVWDPFVGDGSVSIALASVLNGIPPGSPTHRYPFKLFPCFDQSVFMDVVGDLRVHAHPGSGQISSIIGTDSAIAAIRTAERNKERFMEHLPFSDDDRVPLKIPIVLHRVPDAFMPPQGQEKLLIVTALPGGGNFLKRIHHFHSAMEGLRKEGRLAGAFVLTNKGHSFKQVSARDNRWLVDLRFLDDNRREVELLRLV